VAPCCMPDDQDHVEPEAQARARGPQWPPRLVEVLRSLRLARDARVRADAFGEAWTLINSVLFVYLRTQAYRLPGISREDMEDVAAQKSLDLVRRAESGTWDVSGRSPAEIAAFMAAVARNGLLSLRQRREREEALPQEVALLPGGPGDRVHLQHVPESPDVRAECRAYVTALRQCVQKLERRARLIWFLRVLCELHSQEIAGHPMIRLKPSHVDVILHRVRREVRDCMRRGGYAPEDMPTGTFVELWRVFRSTGVL
jgi:DNA-directed RNA polymerase specialized sigma24 family protein